MPLRHKLLEKLFLKAGMLHDAMDSSNVQQLSSYLGSGRLDSIDFVNIARQVAVEGVLHDAMDAQVAAIIAQSRTMVYFVQCFEQLVSQ